MANKELVVADTEKIEWESLETLPKVALVKILMRDEETRVKVLIIKTEESMKVGKHKRPSDCHVLVLEGKLVDGKMSIQRFLLLIIIIRVAGIGFLLSLRGCVSCR